MTEIIVKRDLNHIFYLFREL